MMSQTIIGMGNTAKEALLYARLNQISFDKGVKLDTISCKTRAFEIEIDFESANKDSSYIIMAIHFAHAYYRYNSSALNKTTSKTTHSNRNRSEIELTKLSQLKYYNFLKTYLGEEQLIKIMEIYGCDDNNDNNDNEMCLALKVDDSFYKFMY